jgi:hypothetical protein
MSESTKASAELAKEIGQMIGSTLNIARTPMNNYRTEWGVKTDEGLGRVVLSIIAEATVRLKYLHQEDAQ